MDATTSSEKPRRKSESDNSHPIKNVTISDAKTGFVLVERIFKWPEEALTANLGSLILSFYQFAREVDDGGCVFV
jgi:hypothetical protein